MTKIVNYYNGILLYDKPAGITSHDAVLRIRKIIKLRRVGHTGTLDARAIGLLVICLGRATKMSRFVSDLDKVYEAQIYLGKQSKTYDSEGIYLDQKPMLVPDLKNDEIIKVLEEYTGIIKQKVPAYSAVKVNGQRLYKLARKGIEVELPVKEVEIKDIKLLSFDKPYLSIRITCSKGTYVRSIAHEIGITLGCGAYLSKLKRLSVGHMTLENALSIEEIEKYHNNHTLSEKLIPYDKVLNYGAFKINNEFKNFVISGKNIMRQDIVDIEGCFNAGDRVFLKDSQGKVLAVGTAEVSSQQLKENGNNPKLFSYIRVLN